MPKIMQLVDDHKWLCTIYADGNLFHFSYVLKIREIAAHAKTATTHPCPANGEWWKLVGFEVPDPFCESHSAVKTLRWQKTPKN
jgi:hypothetical protein